ncbi:hydroxyacid dehydrogenase [Peterkaempfera griseoplana]|uniref:hydroxyacid dehydrogenase n=1 Tax=Peterkaempfera griseoplana TaxID=66896 RepID=UPI0006E25F56|nr:hydroxyacid dehydrogenase [Peterkaempfera griseoplana]
MTGGRTPRPAAVLAMSPATASAVLGADARRRLLELVDVDLDLVLDDLTTAPACAALARAEVLVTGWGCPPLDEEVLRSAPRLRAVVHTAGTVKHHVTEACWRRGIQVTSAAAANAVPVAEYTLAAILFANKRVLPARDAYRSHRGRTTDWHARLAGAGNYRRRIGIIGASRIGRRVIGLLRPFDLEVLLSDPWVEPDEAARLGARLTALPELFATSDVISVHAPWLPGTEGLVSRALLAAMPDGATLINTARGALVDQQALEEELVSGRIDAVLDVTSPEVLPASSVLYTLPNVLLTPHIAGSMGGELRRMADFALDELERWTSGAPFLDPVLPEAWDRTA